MKQLILFNLILSVFFVMGCGDSQQKQVGDINSITDSSGMKSGEVLISNPEEFKYKLPQSDYYYDIKFKRIYVDTVKAAFETKKDQYDVSKKVDGYLLKVKFTMTNPYDKEMMAPIPDYFFLASETKAAVSSSTTYNRDCHCDIDNSSEITLANGKELWSVSEGKCGYNDYCLKFKPNETKTFIIKFTDPFFTFNARIVFCGFDRKWNNPDYTIGQENGLIVDLVKKQVISEYKF